MLRLFNELNARQARELSHMITFPDTFGIQSDLDKCFSLIRDACHSKKFFVDVNVDDLSKSLYDSFFCWYYHTGLVESATKYSKFKEYLEENGFVLIEFSDNSTEKTITICWD